MVDNANFLNQNRYGGQMLPQKSGMNRALIAVLIVVGACCCLLVVGVLAVLVAGKLFGVGPVSSLGSRTNKAGMLLVQIPAGPFKMGSDNTGRDNEKPLHTVTLPVFWIDQTETTNGMFATFVKETGYKTEPEINGKSQVFNMENSTWEPLARADWQHPHGPETNINGLNLHPVVNMTWNDANAYCKWVGGRLPSEAEWKKAARGTDGRRYPWGDETPTGKFANYGDKNLSVDWADKTADDGFKVTAPVKSFPAGVSLYGVYDMAGNVWEWVADWYDVYPGGDKSASNDFGEKYRALRGGSWGSGVDTIRVSSRGWVVQADSFDDQGFRCAYSK